MEIAQRILADYPNQDDLMDLLGAATSFYNELDETDVELNAETERMLQQMNAWYADDEDELSDLPDGLSNLHIVIAGFSSWCHLLAYHYRHTRFPSYCESDFAATACARLDLDLYGEDVWLNTTLTHVAALRESAHSLDCLFDELRTAIKNVLAFDFCDLDERIENFRPFFRSYRTRREIFRQSLSALLDRTSAPSHDGVDSAPGQEFVDRAIAYRYGDEETGVLSDQTEARRLFKSASTLGSWRADWELAQMALKSSDADRVDQAISHCKECARKGKAFAYLELAILFVNWNERNTKISINNYIRSTGIDTEHPSPDQCYEVLGYLRQLTRAFWPAPRDLVSVFSRIQSSLMLEFTVDLQGLGIYGFGLTGPRLDFEEEGIDRVEDCLDQM